MLYGHQDTKKDVDLLEQVQRRATKQVPGLRDMEYSDRLKHLKLPTLVFRRIREDMIEIYEIINVYDPKVASQPIQLNKNMGTRGHSIKIRRDHANRDIRRHYLMQRAATMWNYLPEAVFFFFFFFFIHHIQCHTFIHSNYILSLWNQN